MSNTSNVTDNTGSNAIPAGDRTPTRRSLSPKAAAILAEYAGSHPVWIRAPSLGPERWTGLTRAKLYELAGLGRIRSVSLREPGRIKGVRLFHLASILEFIENAERGAQAQAEDGKAD